MLQSDRGELKVVANPANLAAVLATAGLVTIRDTDLLTGDVRNAYSRGMYVIDVDAANAIVRSYKQL